MKNRIYIWNEKITPRTMSANCTKPRIRLDKKIPTSTPLKKTSMICVSELEWLSPVEKKSHRSSANPIQESKKCNNAAITKSLDIIRPDDESLLLPKDNLDKDLTINDVPVGSGNKENKKFVIMDSEEEEEFSKNRDKTVKRTKIVRNIDRKRSKVEDKNQIVDFVSGVEETAICDTQNRITEALDEVSLKENLLKKESSEIKENKAALLNTSLKKSRLEDLESSHVESSKRSVAVTNKLDFRDADKNPIRRSTRKRCRVLEYWNGERMEISKDYPLGLGEIMRHGKIVASKRTKKIQEVKRVKTDKKHISIVSIKSKMNRNNKRSEIEEKRSILKLRTNITSSKANVRFSNFGTGTTIERPISEKNNEPEWLINFDKTQLQMKLFPDSEKCVVYRGLDTVDGSVSSAVICMRPKFKTQSQAPDRKHLIFCVMLGTVKVTIGETSEKLEPWGHFAINCGRSYSIENIGKLKAVVSFFTVACNCRNS